MLKQRRVQHGQGSEIFQAPYHVIQKLRMNIKMQESQCSTINSRNEFRRFAFDVISAPDPLQPTNTLEFSGLHPGIAQNRLSSRMALSRTFHIQL